MNLFGIGMSLLTNFFLRHQTTSRLLSFAAHPASVVHLHEGVKHIQMDRFTRFTAFFQMSHLTIRFFSIICLISSD